MCGLVGIIGPGHVNQSIYEALTVIQHRGQDAAGIMTCEGTRVHLRKDLGKNRAVTLADIKGTAGKVQNADVVILMERNGNQLKFRSFSKDSDLPIGFLLEVSPEGSSEAKFKYLGDLGDLGTESQKKAHGNARKMLDAMAPREWASTGQLKKATGFSPSSIRNYLQILISEGEVEHNGQANRWSMYRRNSEHIKDKP